LANARIASFIAVSLPVREASYFVLKAKCAAIVVADAAACLGQLLVSHLSTAHQVLLPYVRIAPHLQTAPLASTDITISSNRYLDDNAAALIIFTSGTTGPPKGAVMRRGFLHDNCEPIIGHFQITEMDVVLHVLPVHHATGIGITFLPFLHAGSCVEFRSGSVDIAWLWERWKQGGVDFFSGVPTIYMRMMRYFDQKLAPLPPSEAGEYIAGARSMRGLICGTSALPSPVAKFWTSILGGNRRIITRYGATEIGPVFTSAVGSTEEVPEGSVGPVFPGVTVKLSDGEEGEILVKSPYMFAR
jgi:malonyl-CoA/methylmalonyl-CoA synthetase